MALEGSKCVLIHGSWSGSLLAWMLDNAADQSNKWLIQWKINPMNDCSDWYLIKRMIDETDQTG